jgi:hypothetical protein
VLSDNEKTQIAALRKAQQEKEHSNQEAWRIMENQEAELLEYTVNLLRQYPQMAMEAQNEPKVLGKGILPFTKIKGWRIVCGVDADGNEHYRYLTTTLKGYFPYTGSLAPGHFPIENIADEIISSNRDHGGSTVKTGDYNVPDSELLIVHKSAIRDCIIRSLSYEK